MDQVFPVSSLRNWFFIHRRDLPWRKKSHPYAVWVSEVMLQQTRVSVVIPYFLAWMERFPTIEKLAEADLDEVIKAWEGLGYYSRARNLHAGAKQVVSEYGGVLPQKELRSIKGIGEYTAGAIEAFAFHQKAAAVDGNVLRVMARFFGVKECITLGSTKKNITLSVEKILPDEEPWVITEALIELGATVCGKKADCARCPLQQKCRAYEEDLTMTLPIKTKKNPITSLYRFVTVITDGSHYLLQKGEKGKVMADLYEFPYKEIAGNNVSEKQVVDFVEKELQLSVNSVISLEPVQHGFTRYRAYLLPWLVQVENKKESWIAKEELFALPFSSGHKKIIQQLNPIDYRKNEV